MVAATSSSQEVDAYAREVKVALEAEDLRVEMDLRSEKIGLKVREHSMQKVPVVLVVGQREAEGRSVSLRRRGSQESSVVPLEAVSQLACEALPPDQRRV